MGRKKVKIEKECPVCGNMFETYPANERKTCSKKCMGINQRGKNNPNYGNKWSDEQRKQFSEYQKLQGHLISERVKKDWEDNIERRQQAASTMSETMSQMVGERNHFYGKTHNDETKKIIGEKSSAKFTPKFKKRQRSKMEDTGRWIPLEKKSDYEIYFNEANWVDKMFDLVENGIEMLNEHGIFHASQNNNGVVRDHIVGRRYGFKHLVYPEILRHPCNCQILRQRDNVSKGQRGKGRPDCDTTLSELFERIENYQGDWFEHKLVLQLIKDYRVGGRWERNKEVPSDE